MREHAFAIRRWFVSHWKRLLVVSAIVLSVGTLAIQVFYPTDKLVPFLKLDGVSIGGQTKEEAIKTLNDAYTKEKVRIFAGEASETFDEPTLAEIGLNVNSTQVVEKLAYPWYIRAIPTSLWWYGLVTKTDEPAYTSDSDTVVSYIQGAFGDECWLSPKNPRAEVSREKITIIKGVDGGKCKKEEVVAALEQVKPSLRTETNIRLKVEPVYPAIETAELEKLVAIIESKLKRDIPVVVGDETIALEAPEVRSWLVFSTEQNELRVLLDGEKANSVLQEKMGQKLTQSAGVTKVTTYDFTEVSREDGATGRELDVQTTADRIVAYLTDESDEVQAAALVVEPRVEYSRSYSSSNEGLSALIANYAKDKPGVYGVSLIELSGQRRRADYNASLPFTTASTYKVYVAYSVLKRVESGAFSWNESAVNGKDMATCFDDMIVLSDNACAEAFVQKIGYTPLHQDVTGLGLKGTSFIDRESFKTTAGDLSNFMAMLESGQLPLSSESRSRLIDAMKRNVYRRGIPDGASGTVADKVGFLDGLLHDTAIVYSPSGTYVLTILTDGSSWANIADLTRQIEKIRG